MDLQKTLGQNIRHFRLIRGLTQRELADLVDIEGSGYISRIERGESWPRGVLLEKFCKVLKVSPQDLVKADLKKSSKKPTKNDIWAQKIESLLKDKREKDLKKIYSMIKNLFD